jgi:hypothetical protein
LTRQAEARLREERKSNLTKYIPTVSKSIFDVLQRISLGSATVSNRPNLPKIDVLKQPPSSLHDSLSISVDDLIRKVKSGEINHKTLIDKLTEYIDLTDVDQMFEYVSTRPTIEQPLDFHLVPFNAKQPRWTIEHPLFIANLLQ